MIILAAIMEDKKNYLFRKLIKESFRITLFREDFKPMFSFRFTLFAFILGLIGYATLIIIITTFIIAKTSLKEYIPGYGKTEEKEQMIQLLIKMDSLQENIQNKNVYVQSILKALRGENDSVMPPKNVSSVGEHQNLKAGEKEINVRKEIEQEGLSNKSMSVRNNDDLSAFQFLPPVKGIVINKFNPNAGHFGIDFVGKEDHPVRCVDKGIVIYSEYSMSDGNFVIVSHFNGFISVYKHLSSVMKIPGSMVGSNDIIGTMGNTGSESKGVHLHFELWYNQKPINPIELIAM